MVSSSWTLLSILTAVVSESMISSTRSQSQEYDMAHAEEESIAHMEALKKMFSLVDKEADGKISKEGLHKFAKIKSNGRICAQLCKVLVRDVMEVFSAVSRDGQPMALNDFA